MKKIVIALLVISFVLFLIVNNYRQTKPSTLTKIKVLLDWYPNTNHTGLYVAKEKGFYKDANIDIEILESSGGDPIMSVANNSADFAISSQEAVTLARAKEVPIKSIAAIIQHNTSAFASLSSSNIKTVKDFEGKRYGGWGSPIEEAVLKAVMSEAKADYAKVKNITIGETDFFKTIGKESDFQWIFYGWDGVEAQRRDISLNLIMLKDLNKVLDYYTPVIITNDEKIVSKKELVQSFINATTKGYQYAEKNPEESAKILLTYANGLNEDLVYKSQQYLSTEYAKDSSTWGKQTKDVWDRYTNWLFEHKLIERNVPSEEMFTNEFINEKVSN